MSSMNAHEQDGGEVPQPLSCCAAGTMCSGSVWHCGTVEEVKAMMLNGREKYMRERE